MQAVGRCGGDGVVEGLDSNTETLQRFCPVCGRIGPEPLCTKDQSPTVLMRAFSKAPRNYLVGDVVGGRYRITGSLGAGGFAAVFAAEHTETHQAVAIKLLAVGEGGSDPTAIRRFVREARVTASLTHPNTVRVFDIGQDDAGPLFLAMELLRGQGLNDRVRANFQAGRTMGERELIELATQVLGSLGEAHAQGLVHRDLKPANIMLVPGPDGGTMAKVLDFGIARTADSSLTNAGSVPGTPAYMSPEQCYADVVDARSDLYSLAVVLFVCATNSLPFEHKDPMQLMMMHAKHPAPDPRTRAPMLSEGFAGVLLRALAKSPDARYPDAKAMREDLLRVLAGTWQPSADPEPGLSDATVVVQRPKSGTIDLQSVSPLTPGAEPTLQGAVAAPVLVSDATERSLPPGVNPTMPMASGPAASTIPVPGATTAETARDAQAPALAGSAVAAQSSPPAAETGGHAAKYAALAIVAVAVLAAGGWFATRSAPVTPAPAAIQPPPPAPVAAPAAPAPASDPRLLQAKAAFDLCVHAETLEKKLDYAKEAARLAPEIPEYTRMVAALQAQVPAPVAAPAEATPAPAAAAKPKSAAKPAAPSAPALKPQLVE